MAFVDEFDEIVIAPRCHLYANGEMLVRTRTESTMKTETNKNKRKRKSGQKHVVPPLDTVSTEDKLQQLYAEMHERLSKPRVHVSAECDIATFNADDKSIEVVRKVNDLSRYGYMEFGHKYLHNYEALFLLELGRLHIEYHNMALSIEQAYVLLLNETAGPDFNTFVVYKHLAGLGCYVRAHKEHDHSKCSDIDYAWLIVKHQINGSGIREHVLSDNGFKRVLEEMHETKKSLLQTQTVAPLLCDMPTPTDVQQTQGGGQEECSKSIIECLEQNTEYLRLKSSFNAFGSVKLGSCSSERNNVASASPSLTISFDIFFGGSSKDRRPSLRVIVLGHEDLFPTSRQLVSTCNGEEVNATPLLICHVGVSKQIQAYLYHF